MKREYSIGEQSPFRLTKESGYRLAKAICETNSEVLCACVDNTCPPTYICVRIRIEESKNALFEDILSWPIDNVETAMGSKKEPGE